MNIIILSLFILLFSGALAFGFNRFSRLANIIGCSGAISACLVGLSSLISFYKGPLFLSFNWQVPYGSCTLAADSLSMLFIIPIYILSGIAAWYGSEYLKHYYGRKRIGSAWLFFNVLVGSMILVVIAQNAILFLLAWEMMSISSFFLVLFEGQKKEAASAGRLYLIATHIGTLFLMVMFILLSKSSGSFNFEVWQNSLPGSLASVIFLCALIGFGTKAGLMPLHIWLPEAHPAAPSHVSAVMSGVMIKTGIYGLLRVITFLGLPCLWWGYLLILIGIISGFLGVLFALSQHDLKRLLAFSSIENIGLILIGLGLGLVGMSLNLPSLIFLGFAGGLLHIVNHAFFKGLLFLGSGIILQATNTLKIDDMGGLLKKLPVTGYCFLIGAATICGLPPLNGFMSEFLIYLASFKVLLESSLVGVVALSIIAFLAIIGALAVVCFTKVFGIIFLGQARSEHSQNVAAAGPRMKSSMLILAGICILMGLGAPLILGLLKNVIVDITGLSFTRLNPIFFEVRHSMIYIIVIALIFLLIFVIISLLRRLLLKNRSITSGPTWDCGYAHPQSKIQYTSSSFVEPIVGFFKGILQTKKHAPKITDYFAEQTDFNTQTDDLFSQKIFKPIMNILHWLSKKLTWLQQGQLQFYILYILVVLILLFIWKL